MSVVIFLYLLVLLAIGSFVYASFLLGGLGWMFMAISASLVAVIILFLLGYE